MKIIAIRVECVENKNSIKMKLFGVDAWDLVKVKINFHVNYTIT